MYFVKECITISAPKSKGRCKKGVANVLSTTNVSLFFFEIILNALISIILSIGFVGVSAQIILVLLFIYESKLLMFSIPTK